jgi:hypothetical protein
MEPYFGFPTSSHGKCHQKIELPRYCDVASQGRLDEVARRIFRGLNRDIIVQHATE